MVDRAERAHVPLPWWGIVAAALSILVVLLQLWELRPW